jgi:hypothetical protein
MKRSLPMCIEAQGYHFQHLLKSNLKHIIVNCCLFIYCYYTLLVYTYCVDLFVVCRVHNLTLIRYVCE